MQTTAPENSTTQTLPQVTYLDSSSVLIIGGGMVGLTLALMLAEKSIKVTILEAIQYPELTDNPHENYHSSFDARNSALSRRTVQIYTDLGLWPKLKQYATPIYQVSITEQQGFGKATLKAHEENVESFGQVIENAWLGRVLLTAVRANNHIQLFDNITVESILQDAQQVHTTAYQKNGSRYEFYSSILIAADGRDSYCRNLLGIGAETKHYNQSALVATIETSKPHMDIAYERFTSAGPLALLPLPDGALGNQSRRRSVVWAIPTGQEQAWLGADNDQKFMDALQASFGGRVGEFTRTSARSTFPLMQVLADKQVVGRVVLMGNAAHTLHPVAGQGFNLCVRDAAVLSDVLAKQAKLQADLGNNRILLDYETSRLKDQKRVITFCDGVVRGFSNQNPFLKLIRNTGMLAFDIIPGFKQLVANYAMGLKS